jgi:hypothetical protein
MFVQQLEKSLAFMRGPDLPSPAPGRLSIEPNPAPTQPIAAGLATPLIAFVTLLL